MNQQNAQEYLPLVQALANGKTIQYNDGGDWVDVEDLNTDSYDPDEYRIKSEPRTWAMVANKLTGTIYSAGGWYCTLPDDDAEWEHVTVMEVL